MPRDDDAGTGTGTAALALSDPVAGLLVLAQAESATAASPQRTARFAVNIARERSDP